MSIQCRNTTLLRLFVNTVSNSGIVQLGDVNETSQRSKALAIQRAIANYEEDEFHFASYELYYLPKKTLQPCVPVNFQSCSPLPNINIGFVRAVGVSASSILRVGCGGPLRAESRIKHIRQFNNRVIS
jgi:spore germination protein PE